MATKTRDFFKTSTSASTTPSSTTPSSTYSNSNQASYTSEFTYSQDPKDDFDSPPPPYDFRKCPSSTPLDPPAPSRSVQAASYNDSNQPTFVSRTRSQHPSHRPIRLLDRDFDPPAISQPQKSTSSLGLGRAASFPCQLSLPLPRRRATDSRLRRMMMQGEMAGAASSTLCSRRVA
ncbi:hypothetical protein K402DRAFT_450918 [Aulographum hederae CBS 113979]|uniref:Uncharacterized protein n=1 Tax=Aulographum hederae CBS 113979 TaxID=1176131 RepID=A0A6G1HC17_9PEZI|nr:hypothetical protein K402DRAFT_450918 [Aulographum hederae CBS 113979]